MEIKKKRFSFIWSNKQKNQASKNKFLLNTIYTRMCEILNHGSHLENKPDESNKKSMNTESRSGCHSLYQ